VIGLRVDAGFLIDAYCPIRGAKSQGSVFAFYMKVSGSDVDIRFGRKRERSHEENEVAHLDTGRVRDRVTTSSTFADLTIFSPVTAVK
jgi:hypothetical protein